MSQENRETSKSARILDRDQILTQMDFLDNKDYSWYKSNIPFFDCPDVELLKTYYYRWELVTKHLTYGSPETGYVFTEFIDRPFWSGAYGAISCPAGHQLYEARWLRHPKVANDYVRYWLRNPGAQPQNYSNWLADSVAAVDLVHPDPDLIKSLLPDLIVNYQRWEDRHFVPNVGLFWQTGHDDGMEYNINSRQTKDILRGAPSYRPSFNAYMWADATAIASMARRLGETATAERFQMKADLLQKNLIEKLWDPRRQFFFPMLRDDESAEGFDQKAGSLTYQTGKFQGDSHGRELIGYVPWAFQMIPPTQDYTRAWGPLLSESGFAAPFGPTTVDRNDPMFVLKNSCCWWSGQSWPYATSQTLKGMAKVIQSSHPFGLTKDDYVKQFMTFSQSHRKNGAPYIAEALNPDNGSYEGHDGYNHSEHYFHSSFCDLVVTGLVGLKLDPSDMRREKSKVELYPLAPRQWDYFALIDVPCRGTQLDIIWDRDGTRYQKGHGLSVWNDSELIARVSELSPIYFDLPMQAKPNHLEEKEQVNFAVNNDGDYYPHLTASYTSPGTSLAKVQDGNYWYTKNPPNRWTSEGSKEKTVEIELDFGLIREIEKIKLYFLDDTPSPNSISDRRRATVQPPAAVSIMNWEEERWVSLVTNKQEDAPNSIEGHRPTTFYLNSSDTTAEHELKGIRRLKFVFENPEGAWVGLTEIEAWGPSEAIHRRRVSPDWNLAYRAPDSNYPRATASFSDRFGGDPNKAIDGRIVFLPTPMNRWTCYESKNDRDWLEIDFGKEIEFKRVELAIYDDRGGVQPPKSISIQFHKDKEWIAVLHPKHSPEKPIGGEWNYVEFDPVVSDKVRVLFENAAPAKSGVTEVMIRND